MVFRVGLVTHGLKSSRPLFDYLQKRSTQGAFKLVTCPLIELNRRPRFQLKRILGSSCLFVPPREEIKDLSLSAQQALFSLKSMTCHQRKSSTLVMSWDSQLVRFYKAHRTQGFQGFPGLSGLEAVKWEQQFNFLRTNNWVNYPVLPYYFPGRKTESSNRLKTELLRKIFSGMALFRFSSWRIFQHHSQLILKLEVLRVRNILEVEHYIDVTRMGSEDLYRFNLTQYQLSQYIKYYLSSSYSLLSGRLKEEMNQSAYRQVYEYYFIDYFWQWRRQHHF